MIDNAVRPTTVREDLPPPGRAAELAAAEPEASPRDHTLAQLDSILASGLEE